MSAAPTPPSEEFPNAMAENWAKKGANSYYYAHKNTSKVADLSYGEGPKLISSKDSSKAGVEEETKRKRVVISSFSWADCTKTVKIYIELPGLDAVPSEKIEISSTSTSFSLLVSIEDVDHILEVKSLYDEISSCRLKRKDKNRLVLILEKVKEFTCASSSSLSLHQKQVIIVTRHGIRVPFPPEAHQPASIFSRDKSRNWFSDPTLWGANKIAALTSHGKKVIELMGDYMAKAVLPPTPYNFTVYADLDSTRRDIETAEAFMRGAWPQLNYTVDDWNSKHPMYMKRLMNQGNTSTPLCSVNGDLEDVVLSEVGGNLTQISVEAKELIEELNNDLDCCQPIVCAIAKNITVKEASQSPCTLMDIPSKWEGRKRYWEVFGSPLSKASSLVEYVQLLYLNGMPWQQLVPNMTFSSLKNLMHIHEESMAIASDFWNARSAASEMLVHLTSTFEQRRSGKDIKGLLSKPSDSLIYYAAHDINIYLLRRLLRLNWLTESYNPNESPPGGFLMFELLSNEQSEFFVKAFFVTQSYEQQRNLIELTQESPASKVFAIIGTCANGPERSCPFTQFKKLVLQEANLDCVSLVDPNVLREKGVNVVVS
eukprot:g6237.t1